MLITQRQLPPSKLAIWIGISIEQLEQVFIQEGSPKVRDKMLQIPQIQILQSR